MNTFKLDGGKVNHLLAALVENGYYEDHRVRWDADYQPSWEQLLMLPAHRTVIGGSAGQRSGSHRGNAWLTPAALNEIIRTAFGGEIDLDPATEPGNPTGARRSYTVKEDGLAQPWTGNVFVNPPYTPLEPWIDKAIHEAKIHGAHIYLLLPIRLDASYHHRLIRAATDVLFLEGRIKFARADGGDSGSPAFGSMIVGIGISTTLLAKAGTVLVPLRGAA